MRIFLSILLIGLLFGSLSVRADSVTGDETHLAKILGLKIEDIAPSPIPGLYQITIGPQVVYVSADGRYIIRGDIIDVHSGDNLTASNRAEMRLAYLRQLGTADMIVFSPTHPQHTITVLTDIDCQYCRVFERERPTLNAMGVAVQYLFFPIDGIGSRSWHKAMAVWCSNDRKSAFEAAMTGKPVTSTPCDTAAMTAGYRFGKLLSLNGTPAIITDDGRLIDGYLPPTELVSVLDAGSQTAQKAAH
ncbi:MAG TPA: DsbC family protein [Gammaproteobacteria bacterium]|nr:DsbC family protein [Gammaproteobacteria bacterium]